MSNPITSNNQQLPTAWEELTGPDFVTAVQQSEGVCIIPIGVIEKHGAHLPLGTDVYTARETALRAAGQEYCIVYPYYFAGQIFEARHQAGTIAYSSELILKLLEETCEEISRNGVKKIITVGLTFFLLIPWICFCFSTKNIIFVRLFLYRKVFALFYMQFDKRELTVGYFKLHRLLYFIRAVSWPTPAIATASEWG